MSPIIEVSHLPKSVSFYAAIAQPLGLVFLYAGTLADIGETTDPPPNTVTGRLLHFGTYSTRTIVFSLCQTASPRQSSVTLFAPSTAAVTAFYNCALRARGPSQTSKTSISDPRHNLETLLPGAQTTDFDGNMIKTVYTYEESVSHPPPQMMATDKEARRVLDWQEKVAQNASAASSVASSVPRSVAGTKVGSRAGSIAGSIAKAESIAPSKAASVTPSKLAPTIVAKTASVAPSIASSKAATVVPAKTASIVSARTASIAHSKAGSAASRYEERPAAQTYYYDYPTAPPERIIRRETITTTTWKHAPEPETKESNSGNAIIGTILGAAAGAALAYALVKSDFDDKPPPTRRATIEPAEIRRQTRTYEVPHVPPVAPLGPPYGYYEVPGAPRYHLPQYAHGPAYPQIEYADDYPYQYEAPSQHPAGLLTAPPPRSAAGSIRSEKRGSLSAHGAMSHHPATRTVIIEESSGTFVEMPRPAVVEEVAESIAPTDEPRSVYHDAQSAHESVAGRTSAERPPSEHGSTISVKTIKSVAKGEKRVVEPPRGETVVSVRTARSAAKSTHGSVVEKSTKEYPTSEHGSAFSVKSVKSMVKNVAQSLVPSIEEAETDVKASRQASVETVLDSHLSPRSSKSEVSDATVKAASVARSRAGEERAPTEVSRASRHSKSSRHSKHSGHSRHSRATVTRARDVPLPETVIDDDADSVLPSDSISCVGSTASRRSRPK